MVRFPFIFEQSPNDLVACGDGLPSAISFWALFLKGTRLRLVKPCDSVHATVIQALMPEKDSAIKKNWQ
jgi:hypothetical protein